MGISKYKDNIMDKIMEHFCNLIEHELNYDRYVPKVCFRGNKLCARLVLSRRLYPVNQRRLYNDYPWLLEHVG